MPSTATAAKASSFSLVLAGDHGGHPRDRRQAEPAGLVSTGHLVDDAAPSIRRGPTASVLVDDVGAGSAAGRSCPPDAALDAALALR